MTRPGDRLSWTHIHADGVETARTGQVWCDGPRVHASPTWWVRPDDEPRLVLVVRPAKRVRAGREVMTRYGPRYGPRAGRVVEKGEHYAESDPRALTAPPAAPPAPTSVRQPPIPPHMLASFMVMGGGPVGESFPGLFPDEEGAMGARSASADVLF